MANSSTDCGNGDTDLHVAVRQHRIRAAKQLIKQGADVRAKNFRGETPLQLAVVNKSHMDLLTEMIPNGTRFNQISFYEGIESIYLAVASRDEDTVQRLAAQSAFNGVDHGLVKMLLDAGADVNSRDVKGVSPLQCAVYTNDFELVRTLVDAGADVNNRNEIGATPLHDAVVCCNEAVVHLLLSRGANIAAKTHSTEEDYYPEETALNWASYINRNESHGLIIKYLLEFGSDLNDKDEQNFELNTTTFINILQHGDINLVNLCIDKYKADLNTLTVDGHNPLSFAVYNKDRRVRDLVLMKSSDNCDNNRILAGAVLHASIACRPELIREALARGVDVDVTDNYGESPLIAAVFQNQAESREYLDDRANLAEERREVMKLLLENGADVNRIMVIHEVAILYLAIKSKIIEIRNVAPRMIIEHTVMVEERTNKRVFDDRNMAVLNGDPESKAYYEDCRVELTAMKNAKIEGTTVTYFSVLTEPLEVVARYARNETIVETFEACHYQSAYPAYAWWLKKKFDAAILRQKMIDQVSIVLSTTLQFTDPSHLALQMIVKYLKETDLYRLIDSASNIENQNSD